uniref:Uncharacterized protein n=1 Tax=Laticauda laticaudata TaxID=8630 RepID=A0A8C5WWL3_LATLA
PSVVVAPLLPPPPPSGEAPVAKCLSHSTSITLYSSMVARASSTDECPLSCLVSRFREADSFSGKPAFRLSRGIFEVSLVRDLGWKYLRALKSLWIAWPITTFPERSLRIWKEAEEEARSDPASTCGLQNDAHNVPDRKGALPLPRPRCPRPPPFSASSWSGRAPPGSRGRHPAWAGAAGWAAASVSESPSAPGSAAA